MAKPIASTMTQTDTLPGEEVEFGIADARWVMRSLADLYSNRELACIREYSTNARDSHIEAGKADVPIEVTLPSAMHPYFTVKDFGIGMSEDTLKNRYTQFGDSSKRDSDDYNGMLGFGCKSAVAYTHTFTVTAVKDGRKTVAVITRKPDYSIVLKVVLSIDTMEPNSVEVQIPVHNASEFEVKAKDFYRFWPTGTVLVNQKQPEWAVGDKIADDLYYYPQSGKSYVVMGSVGYQIVNPEALFPSGMNRISFVAYVPNGAVEFTPNREALKYSEHTKAALHKIITDFSAQAIQTAKDEIDGAKTHWEAYAAWSNWKKIIGGNNLPRLFFKGEPLTDIYKISGDRYNRHYGRYNTNSIAQDYIENTPNTLIITDFVNNLTATHKRMAREWCDLDGNPKSQYIIFTQEKAVASPWIDPNRVVSWERVKKEAPKPVRVQRTTNSSWGRKAGSFDLVSKDGRKNEQDVPNATPLYFCSVQEYNGSKNLAYVLGHLKLDHEVVLVPANRQDKFLRFYPKAKPIFPDLENMVKYDGESLLSDDAKKFLSTHNDDREIIKKLDMTKVDDPEVKKLASLFSTKVAADFTAEYDMHKEIARALGFSSKFKRHPWEDYYSTKTKPISKAYPLLQGLNHRAIEMTHVYLYMNSVYNARKDGKNV